MIESGIIICDKDDHSLNVPTSIDLIEEDRNTWCKLEHSLNA